MNPFLLILLQAGVNIARGHVSNAAGGEVLDTTSFILDAAKAIDDLYREENGTPLDWSTIRHHSHLPPSGEPATEGPPADIENPPDTDAPGPDSTDES